MDENVTTENTHHEVFTRRLNKPNELFHIPERGLMTTHYKKYFQLKIKEDLLILQAHFEGKMLNRTVIVGDKLSQGNNNHVILR